VFGIARDARVFFSRGISPSFECSRNPHSTSPEHGIDIGSSRYVYRHVIDVTSKMILYPQNVSHLEDHMSRSKRPLQVWSWEVRRCGLFIGSRAGRTSSSSDPPLSIPHLPYRTYHSQSSIEEMALSEAELAAQALAMDKAEQVYMLISFFLEVSTLARSITTIAHI
jgi:hypothetical protein